MLAEEDRHVLMEGRGVEEREWVSLCHGEGRRGMAAASLGDVGVETATGDIG